MLKRLDRMPLASAAKANTSKVHHASCIIPRCLQELSPSADRQFFVSRAARSHFLFSLFYSPSLVYFTMKIEWASHFRSDGSKRKPPPSVMHGWLAKMRGTLLGNEALRTKGMQEMRAARHYKKSSPKRPQRKSVDRRDTGSSALFGALNPKPRPVGRGTQYRQTSSHRVVGQPPRRSSHNSSSRPSGSRQASLPTRSPRATPQRRHTGR
ncbi:hypothetical protein C8R44DRAFT_776870 [Mycena epipterygia]|nr:hypothetical protein C8R44DRAFT_776870 [Mycena epipterygia]